MRVVVLSLLLILNLILESTVFQFTRIFGIKPDFFIVIIVAYAIIRGSNYSAFIGLAAGLLTDMMYGRTFGINSIAYMITGYLIGQAHENVFKDSIIPPIIFNFAAVLVYQHIFFVVSYFSHNLTGIYTSYIYVLSRIILPQALYNVVVGTILYRYIYKLDELRFMDKRIY